MSVHALDLTIFIVHLIDATLPSDVDPIFFGIGSSILAYAMVHGFISLKES